jgi:hypothetical protein
VSVTLVVRTLRGRAAAHYHLHEGGHSAATLALESGASMKDGSLGSSTGSPPRRYVSRM